MPKSAMAQPMKPEDEMIFVDLKVKDLPPDLQKKHKERGKKRDVLHKKLAKLSDQGDKEIRDRLRVT